MTLSCIVIKLGQSVSDRNLSKNKLVKQHNQTMKFFTHFHFESVLLSNKHSWTDNRCYSFDVAEATSWLYPLHLSHLTSNVFLRLLHDKHFETDEKISCRVDGVDESITPFYKTIHWPFPFSLVFFTSKKIIWSCFLFITAWFSLYILIKWNYFLNNFYLLDDLLFHFFPLWFLNILSTTTC